MSSINMKLYKDNDEFYNVSNIESTFEDNILKFIVENTNNEFNLRINNLN